MGRRAILQIGTEKTGSTTLQSFLATNRGRLRANGYLYPAFCGHSNHTGLAAYAMAPGKRDGIRAPFGYRSEADVEPMRARLREAAGRELQGEATAIFCSEHCHSRLDDRGGGGGAARLPRRLLHRRPGQRLPAAPGRAGAQPLLDPAEERRHRQADPAADGPGRSLLQLRSLPGAVGDELRAGERARPPVRSRRARGRRRRPRLRRGLGPRRARGPTSRSRTRTSRSTRWPRSSCAR